jgi:hypothetical protein
MQYGETVVRPDTTQHIVVKADPRFYQAVNSTAANGNTAKVPDGGSAWTFILAAITVIGWSAARRLYSKILRRSSTTRL